MRMSSVPNNWTCVYPYFFKVKFHIVHACVLIKLISHLRSGQTKSKWFFFKLTFLPKNERINSTLLLCDLFSFVFWKKLTIPKRHFEINWPIANNCVTTAWRLSDGFMAFAKFRFSKRITKIWQNSLKFS